MSLQPPQPPSDRRAPVEEHVFFDGAPSWVGRPGTFLISFFIAAVLLVVPVVLQINGHGHWILIACAILLAIGVVMAQVVFQRSLRYRITNCRVDFQRGILTRRIDSLELWYVDHISFRQNLLERFTGTGTIELTTDDEKMPHLIMYSIPGARQILEHLKTSVIASKRQRGLLEMEGPSQGGPAQ